MTASANPNAFTTREQEIMAMAWQCFEGEPKVDYKKLAGLCGMTNPASASNAWAKIKKKLQNQAGEMNNDTATATEGGDSPTKATPKATPKRKKKTDADADDAESPTKKAKTPKGKGKGAKSEAKAEEDGDANASPVKKEDEEDD